jgi:methylmalonyl-CoA mutase cobalamin-binding subunit
MELEVLRERLHEYINAADEQHLTAIYVLVGGGAGSESGGKYDDATMNMIYERRKNHRKGISKSYTAEESMEKIRSC